MDTIALSQWHTEYLAFDADSGETSAAVSIVNADHLDSQYTEDIIKRYGLTTVVANGFCQQCSQMLESWPDDQQVRSTITLTRPFNTHGIEAALRLGCHFCSFLCSRLAKANVFSTFRKIERRLALLDDNKPCQITIRKGHPAGQPQTAWLDYPGKSSKFGTATVLEGLSNFRTRMIELPDPIDLQADIVKIEQGSQANASAAVVRRWTYRCDNGHRCKRSDVMFDLPTRLLYIKHDHIRLILTSELVNRPTYCTLSYCWGDNDSIKLTMDTLDDMLLFGLDMLVLPNVYKDAISLARLVGLDYIWIDALCIIQDEVDNHDWHAESSAMRAIYGGSHINIASASATSVHGRLFGSDNWTAGLTYVPRRSSTRLARAFFEPEAYAIATAQSHLASRAWALQERLLAPRTVYCGEQGVLWECRENVASDVMEKELLDMKGSQLVRPLDRAWVWDDIVHRYSDTDLTIPSDKLPALSGIAEQQHSITGDEYLAGMWRKKLIEQLVWEPAKGTNRRASTWRAPSWSWMSLIGRVQYSGCWTHRPGWAMEMYASVLNASTVPRLNPFSSIISAELKLACKTLIRGAVNEVAYGDENICGVTYGNHSRSVTADSITDDCWTVGDTVYLLPLYRGMTDQFDDHRLCQETENPWKLLSTKLHLKSDRIDLCGIVLRSVDGRFGWFQRIGCFHINTSFQAQFEYYHNMLDSIAATDEKNMAEICCRAQFETKFKFEVNLI